MTRCEIVNRLKKKAANAVLKVNPFENEKEWIYYSNCLNSTDTQERNRCYNLINSRKTRLRKKLYVSYLENEIKKLEIEMSTIYIGPRMIQAKEVDEDIKKSLVLLMLESINNPGSTTNLSRMISSSFVFISPHPTTSKIFIEDGIQYNTIIQGGIDALIIFIRALKGPSDCLVSDNFEGKNVESSSSIVERQSFKSQYLVFSDTSHMEIKILEDIVVCQVEIRTVRDSQSHFPLPEFSSKKVIESHLTRPCIVKAHLRLESRGYRINQLEFFF